MYNNFKFNRLVCSLVSLALGAVFSAEAQNFSAVRNFGTIQYDGQSPFAALAVSGSTLYGAASAGGTNNTGAIFSINRDGSGYSNLYDFSALGVQDGRAPEARLLVVGNVLYGSCASGGASGTGTIFRLNTDGTGFTNLHSFASLTGSAGLEGIGEGVNIDGAYPHAALVLSGANLIGVAAYGGANGNGTVFVDATNGSIFGVIHNFSSSPNGVTNNDGGYPYGNLVMSGTTFYGTSSAGGAMGNGTIYSISYPGGNFTNLHSFGGQIFGGPLSGELDGTEPGWGLTLSGTNLYGTAQSGGEDGLGTVFTLNTSGSNYQTLYAFTAQSVGQEPLSDLVLLGANLFGTTYFGGSNFNGTLFSVSINGANTFDNYYQFPAFASQNNNNAGGAHPYGGLVFAGTNLYGTAASGGLTGYGTIFQLTVPPGTLASIPPLIQSDVQTPFYVYLGGSVSNSVTANGPNLSYQWQLNGVNLTDGGNISGAKSNVLMLFRAQGSQGGNYQVIISNLAGSVTSSVAPLTVVGAGPITFNGNGFDWTGNQSGVYGGPIVASDVMTATADFTGEARSFFFNVPQYIGAFQASFIYQDYDSAGADGVAFILQNDPRGPAALGDSGGSLGLGGSGAITPSAELELNIYAGNGENTGYAFLTNGLTGADGNNGNYQSTGGINLASGHPVNVSMRYGEGQLALTFADTVSKATFQTNLSVGDLAKAAGGATAYLGFTGGDGGVTSYQLISDFSFVSIPTESVQVSAKSVVISWPAAIPMNYALQSNSTLAGANWVTLTNQPVVVGTQNEITLPLPSTNRFYRLVLP